jgi:hypothetical protein
MNDIIYDKIVEGKWRNFFYEIDGCINGALFGRNIIIELK